jgi:hypothetical protein
MFIGSYSCKVSNNFGSFEKIFNDILKFYEADA